MQYKELLCLKRILMLRLSVFRNYIVKLIACGVFENSVRWCVRHAELYIKTHDLRLKLHSADTVDKYLADKGRNIHLKHYDVVRWLMCLRRTRQLTYSRSIPIYLIRSQIFPSLVYE